MNKTFNFILNSLLKTTTELNLTEVSLEVENALKNTKRPPLRQLKLSEIYQKY